MNFFFDFEAFIFYYSIQKIFSKLKCLNRDIGQTTCVPTYIGMLVKVCRPLQETREFPLMKILALFSFNFVSWRLF